MSGVELTTATGSIVAELSDDFFEVTVNEDEPESTLVSEIAGKSMYWEAPIATVLSTLGAGPHVAFPAWLATRRHCPEMIGWMVIEAAVAVNEFLAALRAQTSVEITSTVTVNPEVALTETV
jgi:hypothetical protein